MDEVIIVVVSQDLLHKKKTQCPFKRDEKRVSDMSRHVCCRLAEGNRQIKLIPISAALSQ